MQHPSASKEIDRLGARLLAGAGIAELAALEAWRASFSVAQATTERELATFGYPVTGRPSKSTLSIIEKLRRTRLRLSRMQDIAGLRVIVPSVEIQDELAARLGERLDVTRRVDRRVHPSHGYRAVHLMVIVDKRIVEVQLRTLLQHLWAEMSERIADCHGQAIKYGEGPAWAMKSLSALSNVLADIEIDDGTRPPVEMVHRLKCAQALFTDLGKRVR